MADIDDTFPVLLTGVGLQTALALCKMSDYFTIMVEAVCGSNLTPHKMNVAVLKTELEQALAAQRQLMAARRQAADQAAAEAADLARLEAVGPDVPPA